MNAIALLLFRDLARREGLPDDSALKYGVVGATLGLQPVSMIVVQTLIQREAAAARQAKQPAGVATPPVP